MTNKETGNGKRQAKQKLRQSKGKMRGFFASLRMTSILGIVGSNWFGDEHV
jgi:hypothetical protein